MQHVGLLTPLEEVEGDAELVAATRAALEEGVHQLADTVRNSLNFYRMQEGAETVERALLTGPVLAIPGFAGAAPGAAQAARRARVRGRGRPRTPSSTRPASRSPPGSPSTIASRPPLSRAAASRRGRGAGGAVEQKLR